MLTARLVTLLLDASCVLLDMNHHLVRVVHARQSIGAMELPARSAAMAQLALDALSVLQPLITVPCALPTLHSLQVFASNVPVVHSMMGLPIHVTLALMATVIHVQHQMVCALSARPSLTSVMMTAVLVAWNRSHGLIKLPSI